MKVRFIEWMPFSGNAYDAKRFVPYAEMMTMLPHLVPLPSVTKMTPQNGGPPARRKWASSRPCPSTSAGLAIGCGSRPTGPSRRACLGPIRCRSGARP